MTISESSKTENSEEVWTTNAEPTTDLADSSEIAFYGLPGYRFLLIHIAAIVCMAASLVASSFVIHRTRKKKLKLSENPIAVRLAFYLAICDIGFYSNHIVDHTYILFTKRHYPFAICFATGFVIYIFGIAQSFLVLLTSVVSVIRSVFGKTVNWGNYDWKMLAIVFGSTTLLSVLGACFQVFGPGDMM